METLFYYNKSIALLILSIHSFAHFLSDLNWYVLFEEFNTNSYSSLKIVFDVLSRIISSLFLVSPNSIYLSLFL